MGRRLKLFMAPCVMECGSFICLDLNDPNQAAIVDQAGMDLVCLDCHTREILMEENKHLCYYCEEIVYYGLQDEPDKYSDLDDNWTVETWRHEQTQRVACNTIATPSNVQVLEDGMHTLVKPSFKLIQGQKT